MTPQRKSTHAGVKNLKLYLLFEAIGVRLKA